MNWKSPSETAKYNRERGILTPGEYQKYIMELVDALTAVRKQINNQAHWDECEYWRTNNCNCWKRDVLASIDIALKGKK